MPGFKVVGWQNSYSLRAYDYCAQGRRERPVRLFQGAPHNPVRPYAIQVCLHPIPPRSGIAGSTKQEANPVRLSSREKLIRYQVGFPSVVWKCVKVSTKINRPWRVRDRKVELSQNLPDPVPSYSNGIHCTQSVRWRTDAWLEPLPWQVRNLCFDEDCNRAVWQINHRDHLRAVPQAREEDNSYAQNYNPDFGTPRHVAIAPNDAAQWPAAQDAWLVAQTQSARPLEQPGWVRISPSTGGVVRAIGCPRGRGGTTHTSPAARLARRDRD